MAISALWTSAFAAQCHMISAGCWPPSWSNNGLPIHIGAALRGHVNLQTTRGYVAAFNEDLVRHYQAYLDRRRQADEYRPVTESEWLGFEEHFDAKSS